MAVHWPGNDVAFPTGDNALHLVAVYGDGEGAWDGTEEGIDSADWYVVDGLGDATRSANTTTTPHRIFGRSEAITTVSTPDRTVTLNGWFAEGDHGQGMLRAAMETGTVLGYMLIRDRNVGNGYAVPVRVGGGDDTQNAEGGLQVTSFTLAPQGSAVTVEAFDVGEPS